MSIFFRSLKVDNLFTDSKEEKNKDAKGMILHIHNKVLEFEYCYIDNIYLNLIFQCLQELQTIVFTVFEVVLYDFCILSNAKSFMKMK